MGNFTIWCHMKLINGDCIDSMIGIPDKSVDLILTDPPYGTTKCKWDSVVPLDLMWIQLKRIIKPGGAIVLTASQPFTSALVMSCPEWYRYDWVWEKGNATGFFNAKKMPLRAHESVLVFYDSLPTYNPQKTKDHKRSTAKKKVVESECYGKDVSKSLYDSTERYPRSVQFFSSDKQKGNFHPTQKPVALMEYLIKTYTNEGETVLDFTMGSGTTGVACVNTGREFIGIEKDINYFKTAEYRINNNS